MQSEPHITVSDNLISGSGWVISIQSLLFECQHSSAGQWQSLDLQKDVGHFLLVESLVFADY